MPTTIRQFLDADIAKLEDIIERYPKQIPVKVVAELLGCGIESIHNACEETGLFGISWRKPGKVNKGYCIPTGVFVRWYTKGIYLGNTKGS